MAFGSYFDAYTGLILYLIQKVPVNTYNILKFIVFLFTNKMHSTEWNENHIATFILVTKWLIIIKKYLILYQIINHKYQCHNLHVAMQKLPLIM